MVGDGASRLARLKQAWVTRTVGDVMVKGRRSTVDGWRSRGTGWLTVALALVFVVSGVFVPAARGASTDQTQEQSTPTSDGSTTTTGPSPSTSTTYVTIILVVPMTVTTTVNLPFLGPDEEEDVFPPSTTGGGPEPAFDIDEDLGSEPASEDRDTLPAGGPDLAGPSAADANRPGPSTTLRAQPGTSRSNVASPARASSAPANRSSEPAVDMTAASRSPSLLWPGILVVGCLLLLSGPAVARRVRDTRRHEMGHDVRHDVV